MRADHVRPYSRLPQQLFFHHPPSSRRVSTWPVNHSCTASGSRPPTLLAAKTSNTILRAAYEPHIERPSLHKYRRDSRLSPSELSRQGMSQASLDPPELQETPSIITLAIPSPAGLGFITPRTPPEPTVNPTAALYPSVKRKKTPEHHLASCLPNMCIE
jgi:hypothetical protein